MEKLKHIAAYLIVLFITVGFAADKSKVLFVRTAGENFEEAKNGIVYELESEYDFSDFVVEKSTSVEEMANSIETHNPNVIVLMNNTAVSLYKKYLTQFSTESTPKPTVALMAILVNEAISDIQNATGIGYEIPIVTSAVNLRAIVGASNLKKIGIVHRAGFRDFVETNRTYCRNENIQLVTREIGSDNVEKDLPRALDELVKEGIDAVWIPNDNRLLAGQLIPSVWKPFLKKNKLPSIVGVRNFVDPKFDFGMYAVLPDHSALGSQAASVITDLGMNEWKVEESGSTQPPLSVYTILNAAIARDLLDIKPDQLDGVDQVLE